MALGKTFSYCKKLPKPIRFLKPYRFYRCSHQPMEDFVMHLLIVILIPSHLFTYFALLLPSLFYQGKINFI
jgi:hypothetical protein